MAKKRNTEWDVRTQLKEKAGSQGTLFQGGTKYSSDARYPRGYTPERLHEAANAIGGDLGGRGGGYTRGKGASAAYYRDYKYTGGSGRADNAPKRAAVDNLARSTVPMSDLEPAPGRRLSFWIDRAHDQGLKDTNARGAYWHESPAQSTRHDIKVRTDSVDSTTLIHEIGHHVSHMRPDHEGYDSPARQGKEEGFADAYSFEHYRDRRGQPLTGLRMYPNLYENRGAPDEGKARTFAAGYAHGRGEIPDVEPWHTKYSQVAQQGASHVHHWADVVHGRDIPEGQGTLFGTERDRSPDSHDDFKFEHPDTGEEIGGTDKWKPKARRMRWEVDMEKRGVPGFQA